MDAAPERAAAAVRALARAQEATTSAVRLLARAADVDWTGPGAAAFRDDAADVLDGVRRTGVRLGEAEAAAADHLAAVRAEHVRREAELRAAGGAGSTAGLGVPLRPGAPVHGPPGSSGPSGPPGWSGIPTGGSSGIPTSGSPGRLSGRPTGSVPAW